MRCAASAVALLLAGCASAPVQRMEGIWEWGFEQNQFRQSGHTYNPDWGWCLSPESPAFDALLAGVGTDYVSVEVHLVVEGVVSAPSNPGYGHMGLCEREVRVTRVIEVRVIELKPYHPAGD